MGTATGLTAERMTAIEASIVTGGHIDGTGHLILTKEDGSTVDAGAVTAAGISVSPGNLYFPGVLKSIVQAPDSAGLKISGDIDIRWYGTLGSLTGASGFQSLISKQATTATAWMLRETAAGKLQFSVSADGTTAGAGFASATCSVSTTAAAGYRVTWTASSGQVKFFVLDAAGAIVLGDGSKWTQLGTNQTAAVTGNIIYTGVLNPPVTIGGVGNGTSLVSAGTTVTKVEIRNGLDGTLVANPNFTSHTYADSTVVDSAPNTWTLSGFAKIIPINGTVVNNGTTLTFATPNDVRSMTVRWGAANRNPITGWFHVDEFGPVGVDPAMWTTAQTGTAMRAARLAASLVVDLANGYGATVYFQRAHYVIDTDTNIVDPYTGLNYCGIATWDYLEFKGATHYGTMIQIDAGMDCHVFGHPGRLQSDGSQDQIVNVTFTDLVIDGNKALQDGAHTHGGLHLDQHPGLTLTRTIVQNCDGQGYYSTANGEFGTAGVHIVREIVITDSKSNNNNADGWFMSAANRATSYKGVYANGNGCPQARLVGKSVAATLTASGNFIVQVDNSSFATIALLSGDTPASVVSKINTALGTAVAIATNCTFIRFRTTINDAVFNGTTTVQSNTAAFTAADVGQLFQALGVPRGTIIVSRTDATHAVLSNSITAASGVVAQIGTNLITTASANSGTWTVGAPVSGIGIPAGAVIGAVVNGISVTIVDGAGHPIAPQLNSGPAQGILTINGKGTAKLSTKPVTVQAATDTVTFTSPHRAVIGTSMVFSALTGGAGITAGTTYYVHAVVSATQVTLTTTSGGGGSTLDITTDGSAAVAASSLSRFMLSSDTTGGISKVYLQAGSNTTILTNLGLTLTPLQANSDFNNYRVGSNDFRGFYLDHSECHADGLFADSNYGDAFAIHNVDSCHYDNLHATRNSGLGFWIDALNHSTGKGWVSKMNCTDFGASSYRQNATVKAEYYFDNGTEGYGVTKDSTIIGLNGPGDKSTGGNDIDNRFADYSVYIANGVAANGSFDIAYPKYGDGGVLGTLLDAR